MENDIQTSADVKANKSNKKGGSILQIFIRRTFKNLKYTMKGGCIFDLILVGILSILILSVKIRGVVWRVGC